MGLFRAKVVNGRVVVDEPTTLPEGTELELVPADDDDLDATELAALEAALQRSWAEVQAGKTRPLSELLDELRTK